MSLKNKNRSALNRFIWYSSGLTIRELAGLSRIGSNYFAIGGINIFSSFLTVLLVTVSFGIAFHKIYFPICILIGLVIGFLVYIFNRQTINALSIAENNFKSKRNILTLFPLFLFSIFVGVAISIPIKFNLFDIPFNPNLFSRLKELNKITDANISAQITSWSFTLIISLLTSLPTLIQYYSLRMNIKNNRSSLLNELMWYCSGANKDIIRRCPNEYSKYFGIGGTILFTALMATLSGGYAFFTAFDNASLAICFGIFWGAMIFNLDRFIVNTMYTDNKHTISWLELLSGLPRIIIAVFLGIVISYPLELKLFEDEIDVRIEKLKVENLIEYNKTMQNNYSEIGTNNIEIKSMESKKDKLQGEIDIAKQNWQRITKVARKGTKLDSQGNTIQYTYYIWPEEYYSKKKDYDEIKNRNNLDIETYRVKTKRIDEKIAADEKEKGGYESSYNKKNVAISDLSTRMEAFSKLKAEKPDAATASLFIMLLLIIIEISPVLFKMMLASGDYDVIMEAEKNEIKVNETVRISQKNDWANAEILKIVEENKKKVLDKQNELNAEMASNLELLNAISQAQSEIAQVAITKWKESEIIKATNNPENFINKNPNT